MQIDILLQDPRGDEIGTLNLEAVRLAAAGVETAPPDLCGQMAQMIARLTDALARLGFSPVLDPLEVRIAVSRAVLDAPPGGVRIPLQVQALGGSRAAVGSPNLARSPFPDANIAHGATTAGSPQADEWQDLFALSPEEAETGQSPAPPLSGSTDLKGGTDLSAGREPLDQWTALGDIWQMDDEGDEL